LTLGAPNRGWGEREEVEDALVAQGCAVSDVRDAPDRPGREFMFLARQA